jgi:hypothetical protein
MIKRTISFSMLSLCLIAGCSNSTVTRQEISNAPIGLLSFPDNRFQEDVVSKQAIALNDLSAKIVRASTVKGLKIGAAAGCGLAIVSAANAKNCVVGAVAGGAIGSAVGYHSGKRQIAKRVELVDPNRLVRSIRKTNDQMELLTASLPALLAEQDQELEKLGFDRDLGKLSQADYDIRYTEIKSHRAALANSLTLSAQQARAAGDNLKNAATQGQFGLDWHLNATERLSKQAASARSSISLL